MDIRKNIDELFRGIHFKWKHRHFKWNMQNYLSDNIPDNSFWNKKSIKAFIHDCTWLKYKFIQTERIEKLDELMYQISDCYERNLYCNSFSNMMKNMCIIELEFLKMQYAENI